MIENTVDRDKEEGIGSETEGVGISEDFSRQIAQQIEAQIQTQIEMVMNQMNQEIDQILEHINQVGLSPEETERIMENARQTSEHEINRMQKRMQHAQEKLERKLEAAQRRHERRNEELDRRTRAHRKHSWSFQWNSPPTSTVSHQLLGKEPVNEEERLMILRMLEQKKITLEEADQLLAALDNNEE